jgi:hypothetical protein
VTIKPGDEFRPDLEGVCPCGKKFYVVSERFAVMHDLPACERFHTLEPNEYLRYVRQATTGITDN